MAHGLGPDVTTDPEIEHGAEAEILVGEVVAPAGEEVGGNITHHLITLGANRSGRADDDGTQLIGGGLTGRHIGLRHTVEARTTDITPGTTHGSEGTVAPGPTHLVLVKIFVQRHYLAPVAGEVEGAGPVEAVVITENVTGELDFNTLVVDTAGVHEHGPETDDIGGGDGENLVLGLLLVVGDIQVETVVKHAEFGTDFPGVNFFRHQVRIGQDIAPINLADTVISVVVRNIIDSVPVSRGGGTRLGDAAAELPEGEHVIGLERREGLGDNPAQGDGRIEERPADGGAPVIAAGGVQIEHILISNGEVSINGVGADVAMVHLGNGITLFTADGIDSGHDKGVGAHLLVQVLGIAIVRTDDSGEVEVAESLVRGSEEVGVQFGVGGIGGIEGAFRIVKFEIGLLEHAGIVIVEAETAFDLEPVKRVEVQGRLAEHTVALIAVRVHVDVEVRVDMVAGVPVVVGIVTHFVLLVPVLLQGLHVDLTAAPGDEGVQRVVAAVTLVHQVVALGPGVVAREVEGEEAVQGHLRVELGAVARLVRIRNGTGLVTVGQGNTGRGLLAAGLQGNHVVLGNTGLEETLDVVRMRHPRSLLAVAVELNELQTGIQSRTPGFVVTVLNTGTVTVHIREAVLLGIVLIGQGTAICLVPLIV